MIKKVIAALSLGLALFCTTAIAGDVYVDGYWRSDGTYVQPHWRSAPDGNPYNNWSTRGNTNPYTGERGYRSPYPNYEYTPRTAFPPPSRWNEPSIYTTPRNN